MLTLSTSGFWAHNNAMHVGGALQVRSHLLWTRIENTDSSLLFKKNSSGRWRQFFGPKRDEKCCNNLELPDFYPSPDEHKLHIDLGATPRTWPTYEEWKSRPRTIYVDADAVICTMESELHGANSKITQLNSTQIIILRAITETTLTMATESRGFLQARASPIIKSRRVRLAGHVARMTGTRNAFRILPESLKW